MARATEWMQYQQLRKLIRMAIEDAIDECGEDTENDITIAISPDLSEVYATYAPWWDDEQLAACMNTDWHIEHAESIDDADDIADLYFDLR